ncbi:hypothetical protein MJM95_28510, partial [Salmonella enterica subsp. enterica serovar Anatum]|nr:hypothetical protein [Salmonella enterica subsp. enterica serovar Anatum]
GIAADDEKAAWCFKRSSAISRTGYSEYWAGMMFLNGEPGFIERAKLTWRMKHEQGKSVVTVNNPTPYFVSFNSIELESTGKKYIV